MIYTTYVLLPRDTKHVESEVLELLDTYCEDLEVEEYEKPCECVDSEVKRKLKHLAEGKFGEPRQLWERLTEDKCPEEAEIVWEKIFLDYLRFVNQHYQLLCESISPDPDCPECEGKGWEVSTFNRISRWDGWEFDHSFPVLENDADDSLMAQTSREASVFDDDDIGQARIYDLNDIDISGIEVPYAILSPDGWEGCVEGTKVGLVRLPNPIWINRTRQILESFKDHLLVPLKCHV